MTKNRQSSSYHVAIIGGGIIGTAILHELSKYRLRTVLLEKCHDVAEGVTKANSGVLHAGFMVPNGTLKARFNVEGARRYKALANDFGIEVQQCKKLVVAKDDSELPYLKRLLDQGVKNEVRGLSLIAARQIRNLQPNVAAKHALLSEHTAVTLPYQMAIALAENAVLNGAEVCLNAEVCSIVSGPSGGYRIHTTAGAEVTARLVINAAGIHADRIMGLLEPPAETAYPWRGEYILLEEASSSVVDTAVYPVPPADGSGLGVHITPTVNGGILLGPSAECIADSTDTANTTEVLNRLQREALALVPALKGVETIKTYSGIRPKLFGPDSGVRFRDFVIEESERFPGVLNLLGIESPGLTAAPAIATHVIDRFVASYTELSLKTNWAIRRRVIPRLRALSCERKQRLWRENPAWGDLLCHCEQVSRAEVDGALTNPLNAVSINAIRKRTHATLGRCQSSFCLGPIAAEIMRHGYDKRAIARGAEAAPVLSGVEKT